MSLRIGIGKNLRITPSGDIGYCAEYQTVYNAMINKPSDADAIIQNIWLKGMVDGGYFAKAEFLDMFSVPVNTASEALINWKNPGTFNPIAIGAPVFTAYSGFMGAVGKNVSLNFNPTTNGTLIGQNNICVIIGIGTDLAANTYSFYCQSAGVYLDISSRRAANTFYTFCNEITASSIANANGIGHYGISRDAGANYSKYKNLTRTNVVIASTGLPNFTAQAIYNADLRQIRYAFLFSYLAEAEVDAVINLTEAYLDNYGTGLI